MKTIYREATDEDYSTLGLCRTGKHYRVLAEKISVPETLIEKLRDLKMRLFNPYYNSRLFEWVLPDELSAQ